MIDLSIYKEPICKFLTDAIKEFKKSEGSFNSVAIFWNQEEETVYLSFNKTRTIEKAKRTYKNFEKIKNKETEEGGFMQEHFHWRNKYSRYKNY